MYQERKTGTDSQNKIFIVAVNDRICAGRVPNVGMILMTLYRGEGLLCVCVCGKE